MSDPYKVLGVSPNATDEEIKAAYRTGPEISSDNYVNNCWEIWAAEKMKEINEAYDQIQAFPQGGKSGRLWRLQWWLSGAYGNSRFGDVRQMIQQGRISDAEEILEGTPHRLSGRRVVFSQRKHLSFPRVAGSGIQLL